MKIANIVFPFFICGSIGTALLSILVGAYVFNGSPWTSDEKLGMEFAMTMDMQSLEIGVWMKVPQSLFIKSTIVNLVKIEDGDQTPAGLTDVFPVSDKSYAAGGIKFEIYAVEDEAMPVLPPVNKTLVPIAHLRNEAKFPTILRYMMLGGALALKNWTFVKYSTYAGSVLAILFGALLVFINSRMSKDDMVVDLKPEAEDDDD